MKSFYHIAEVPRQSAFRERELTQSELAAQFLEAIERERKAEREQLHNDQLHRLWQKYQQQENDLEEELFENDANHNHRQPTAIRGTPTGLSTANRNHRPQPIGWGPSEPEQAEDPSNDEYDLMAEKRRLVMPWLPVRKRSSPMSKRSSFSALPLPYNKDKASLSGTDEKVAHDLREIFSDMPTAMKSKRSSNGATLKTTELLKSDEDTMKTDAAMTTATAMSVTKAPAVAEVAAPSTTKTTTTTTMTASNEKKTIPTGLYQRDQGDNHDLDHDGYLAETESADGPAREHVHEHEHTHSHAQHGHDDSSHEHDHHHDDEDEHDEDAHAHEHDDDEDGDEDDDDSDEHDDRKKKRAAGASVSGTMKKRVNQEVLKEDQIIPGDLNDFKRKKSVEWSKYFGIDRRKKSTEWSLVDHKPKTLEDYTPTHFRNHDQVIARPKLDSMDQKLKTIEELIIDETIKYTSEHEGKQFIECDC